MFKAEQVHPEHHDFTHFLTFLTFSKNRQTRHDLPNTSVARIPIVTVSLGDLWRIMIGRHIIQCYMLRLAQMNSQDVFFSSSTGSFWGLHLQDKALKQVHYSWTLCKTMKPTVERYPTEINYRGLHYSPGDPFQSQKTKVLREFITHRRY